VSCDLSGEQNKAVYIASDSSGIAWLRLELLGWVGVGGIEMGKGIICVEDGQKT
jgi:hypothetical protein